MIDLEKVLEICMTLGISYEKFMLLYTLHVRRENTSVHLHPKMNAYIIENKEIDWTNMIRDLAKEKLLIILKEPKDGRNFEIKYLQIAEKFVSLLFADPEETWKKFVLRYPPRAIAGDMVEFTSNAIKAGDRDAFNQHVYKNATPEQADEIIRIIEDMFGWDGTKTTRPAYVGISRFILNWDVAVAAHKAQESQVETHNKFRKRL